MNAKNSEPGTFEMFYQVRVMYQIQYIHKLHRLIGHAVQEEKKRNHHDDLVRCWCKKIAKKSDTAISLVPSHSTFIGSCVGTITAKKNKK